MRFLQRSRRLSSRGVCIFFLRLERGRCAVLACRRGPYGKWRECGVESGVQRSSRYRGHGPAPVRQVFDGKHSNPHYKTSSRDSQLATNENCLLPPFFAPLRPISVQHLKWWTIQRLQSFSGLLFVDEIRRSRLIVWYYRLLGARLGRDVLLNTVRVRE